MNHVFCRAFLDTLGYTATNLCIESIVMLRVAFMKPMVMNDVVWSIPAVEADSKGMTFFILNI